ncbi:hypothetical protein A6A04_17420 [Paramagnetospirillum marisnigri]|uniref:HrgC protein n=1 Tax=Paramagnetospirillum marisnigri TaxID=1285242 RepID=A0A178MQD5_9PROT|nr:hypothetical protein [Paramagnetospirillum marisnigri]OAN50733.1 hypothetical protein A6A04_17420 [Paramagnetospirillum marisnigri]
MIVSMQNDAGLTRQVKVGFSWTAFFFGGFVYFFRGMPVHGLIWLVLSVVTFGLSNLFLMFMINKASAHYYLEHGYKPVGPGWEIASPKWGITVAAAA